MLENVSRCPLTWPGGWPRTRPSHRQHARFSDRRSNRYSSEVSIHVAIRRLMNEVEKLPNARQEILSTNMPTRLDGLPYSNRQEPDDPGAALYFVLNGKPRALACDKWRRTADNIVAIAKHIEALRGIDRWGVGTTDRAFAGYAALPPTAEEWWLILGVGPDASEIEIEAAYRRLAKEAHPDHGGDADLMSRLNVARQAALRSA